MKIIYSEDIGLIEEYIKKIKFNKILFLKNNYFDLIDDILQPSFFSDSSINELYCVWDIDKNLSSKTKNKDFQNMLLELENKKINVYFCLNEKEINKNYKEFFDENNVIQLKKLNKISSRKYIREKFLLNKKKVDENILNYLTSTLPLNSLIISSEINKICLLDQNDITIDNIKRIIIENIEDTTFNLINYYFSNNYVGIVNILNKFDEQKNDYFEIFNIMISQIFNLKLYVSHYQQYKDMNKLMKDFDIQYFQLNKQVNIIKFYKIEWIEKILNNLLKLNLYFIKGKKELNIEIKTFLLEGAKYAS